MSSAREQRTVRHATAADVRHAQAVPFYPASMLLHVLRGLFVAAVIAVVWSLMGEVRDQPGFADINLYLDSILIGTIGLSLLVIALDMLTPRKNLLVFSGALLGILGGVVLAYGLGLVADLLIESTAPGLLRMPVYEVVALPSPEGSDSPRERIQRQIGTRVHPGITGGKLVLGMICVYLCVSFVLQTKDDIRFVIPYVEFAKQRHGVRPIVLDTSVLIDGRIIALSTSGVVDAPLVVPRFVLGELQRLADSADEGKRARGRRGLEQLQRLQEERSGQVELHEPNPPIDSGEGVDGQLLVLARRLEGRLLTADSNLVRVAQVRSVDVVSLTTLADAMKSAVFVGDEVRVKLVRPGESQHQAVGYLEDGTMVVAQDGREFIGREVQICVTSIIQTSNGRLIFAKVERNGA